ncbi:MAG: lysophospholipase [Clostridiales bacterium]|nr:lysophospholipase [Clostridiales bacterium]
MTTTHEQWQFPASNGEGDIFANAWLAENPSAIIQIAHGMAEHSARYDDFARFLCAQGFSVVANDHAGHGQSAQGHIGAFASKAGGFDLTINDFHNLFGLAEEKIGTLPRILFGHSMGSILSALYAERYQGLTALALCGPPAAIKHSRIFACIAGFISATQGHLKRSPFIDRLAGTTKDMTTEEAERDKFWLSRDPEVVRKYVADPLCGFDYTAGGYATLLNGYHRFYSKKWGRTIPDIPILIVAGAEDIICNKETGPTGYAAQLKNTGHTRVDLKLFPECRHEIINELNKPEVYDYLCDWFKAQLPCEMAKG